MIHDAEDDQVEAVRHHKRDRGKNHRPTGERVRCIVTTRPQELAPGPETRLKRRWREGVADSASAPAERDASRSGFGVGLTAAMYWRSVRAAPFEAAVAEHVVEDKQH